MWRRKRMLEDFEQEIRAHIEMATQENIDRGMTPEDARYAALRKFGNVTRVKEDTREVSSWVWCEQLLQEDIRFDSSALQIPRLHCRCHPDPHPRHRRQHRHLQRRQRSPASPFALSPPLRSCRCFRAQHVLRHPVPRLILARPR
jgi:hypothetical protein